MINAIPTTLNLAAAACSQHMSIDRSWQGAKNRIVPVAAKLAEILQTWQLQTEKDDHILQRLYKGNKVGNSLGLMSIYLALYHLGKLTELSLKMAELELNAYDLELG